MLTKITDNFFVDLDAIEAFDLDEFEYIVQFKNGCSWDRRFDEFPEEEVEKHKSDLKALRDKLDCHISHHEQNLAKRNAIVNGFYGAAYEDLASKMAQQEC